MAPHLPDEIISEILSPFLHVADELFSDTSNISPFSNNARSSSKSLLVCKQWFRVATPLLYKVVILRSTAQAIALAATLKAVPELGRFIKKLRVEGGYGACMNTILKSSPNIRDLCLSFAIWSTDNTSGLCKGLPLINPRRLVIVDNLDVRNNKHLDALEETVFACLLSWNNLRILGFPYGLSVFGHTHWMLRASNLSETLVDSQLHTIVLNGDFCRREPEIPRFILSLCNIPALGTLQFKRPFPQRHYHRLLAHIDLTPRLKLLAQYTIDSEETKTMSPDSTPSHFIPMQSASEETQEIVWKRVIFFAMSMGTASAPPVPWERSPPSLGILTVSKYFHRLALPYLYECIRLTPENCPKITRLLQDRPDLGSFIRRVFTCHSGRHLKADSINAILSLCRHAHNLEVFAPHPFEGYFTNGSLPVEGLALLAANAGHSLQHLSVHLDSEPPSQVPISGSVLESFIALRVLAWRSSITMTGGHGLHPDSFQSLHTLSIHSEGTIISRLLTDVRLPCLRALDLQLYITGATDKSGLVGFLRVHGHKVLRLSIFPNLSGPSGDFRILDLCPNLTEVALLGPCYFGALINSAPHNSLTKISARQIPDQRDMAEMAFNPAMFPALRDIHVDCLAWPTTERDISKSHVVPMAEALLRHNIKITNGEGRSWTPRLKIQRAAPGGRRSRA